MHTRTTISSALAICLAIVAYTAHAGLPMQSGGLAAVDAPSKSVVSAPADLDSVLNSRCPGAVLQTEPANQNKWNPSTKTAVAMPSLRLKLLEMTRMDQDARQALTAIGSEVTEDDPKVKQLKSVDASNLLELKHLIKRYGFPTPHLVGNDGVHAAWLLTQHADADPTFQAKLLPEVHELVKRGEILGADYALLTDRILVAQGKRQQFGSQFDMSTFTPFPIADPVNVDVRRAALGLGPLKDYACFLKAMYSSDQKSTDRRN